MEIEAKLGIMPCFWYAFWGSRMVAQLGVTVLVVVLLVVRCVIVACRIVESARRQIPDELKETAQIDGAGVLQKARHIQADRTLPR